MTQITPEDIKDFAQYLQGRGCYAPETVRRKILLAKHLQATLKGADLPLDEDTAIDKIWEVEGPGRRRRTLNTTARDLIEFFQARRLQGVIRA